MKYLKRFENFDLGRFNNEEEDNHEWVEDVEDVEDEECEPCEDEDEYEDENSEEDDMRRRVWGDEVVEKKSTKKTSYKKSGLKNPKKADLDKDGKISGYEKKRGKAVQKAVQGEKEEKGKKEEKGLTAAQKKLPEGLRKAIEKKNKKK
jgi:hypothetical protein